MSIVLLVLFPKEICFRIFVINEGIEKKKQNNENNNPPKLAS